MLEAPLTIEVAEDRLGRGSELVDEFAEYRLAEDRLVHKPVERVADHRRVQGRVQEYRLSGLSEHLEHRDKRVPESACSEHLDIPETVCDDRKQLEHLCDHRQQLE